MKKVYFLFLLLLSHLVTISQSTITQYASTVIDKSTEYGTGDNAWSSRKALGAPNVYPSCGDFQEAWAHSTADGRKEFIVLGYSYVGQVSLISIYETYNAGSVDTVFLRDAATGIWNIVYLAVPAAAPCRKLDIPITTTSYNVDAVKITMNSPAVPSWNEIDAVALQTILAAGSKFSTKSGGWSDPTTWAGGTVPGSSDTVVIASGDSISVDGNFLIKSLLISSGATLLSSAGNTLTLGPAGGGKEYLVVPGNLNLSNGTIAVNGNVNFQGGSSLNMSGGEIIVDANDGTDPGSVQTGIDLVEFAPGMATLSFTGGILTIVDPQYHASGQAIAGSYTFGPSSTVKIGNGSSTTSGNNPNGFGGSNSYPFFGHLTIDASTTSGNRHFEPSSTLNVGGVLTITSGKLKSDDFLNVTGNLVNQATFESVSTTKVSSDLINNGTISVTGGSFSILNNFNNNIGGTFSVSGTHYSSIGRNLVNNGSFTSNWVYFANNFGTSTNGQSISGTGTFNIYGIEIVNNNAAGVSMLIPLNIQQLYFGTGKLFLNNNDLTLDLDAYGNPSVNNYVVVNGSGKLVIKNISTISKLFPIGTTTSYSPVTIVKGSGHTFSASVIDGLAHAPYNSSVVNKEWNLTDVTTGSVAADVTFQWNSSDENPGFDRAVCYVGHHDGTAWHPVSDVGPASGIDPYTKTAMGVSTFSPFAVGSNAALPVKLKSFTVKKTGQTVELNWVTENEINASHYEIERSNDGRTFSKIASLQAKGSVMEATYEANDSKPLKGLNYYRLKQVDKDAKFVLSRIAKVDLGKKYTIIISPNPAKGSITIDGIENFRSIHLIDVNGKLVKQWQRSGDGRYNVAELKPGIYLLKFINKSEIQTGKLIIR